MDAVNIEFVSRLSVFVSNVDKKLSYLVIQPPLEHATAIITVLLYFLFHAKEFYRNSMKVFRHLITFHFLLPLPLDCFCWLLMITYYYTNHRWTRGVVEGGAPPSGG